jgi:hypothetical protein
MRRKPSTCIIMTTMTPGSRTSTKPRTNGTNKMMGIKRYAYETYPAEAEAEDPEYEREDPDDEYEHNQGEMLEEDDQDAYE